VQYIPQEGLQFCAQCQIFKGLFDRLLPVQSEEGDEIFIDYSKMVPFIDNADEIAGQIEER
jgi:hypothetical protein